MTATRQVSATCCARARSASDNGLLTQAPPNTGAGWFTLATGAWPGVHGSTNNTFHINGNLNAAGGTQTFSPSRTTAFDNGVLQAETLAQSAERGGKRVAQIEWAGGRGGAINGPTLDFRNFRSGRGVATNYIAPEDSAQFTRRVRAAVRPSAGFAGNAPFPDGRADGRDRLDERAALLQPAEGDAPARPRRHADRASTSTASTPTSTTAATTARRAMTACCSAAPRAAPTRSATSKRASGPTSRSRSTAAATDPLNGKTGSFLIKVERLDSNLSHVRLFHTSVTRAIATWNGWSEPGFTGTFEDFVAERFPSSQAGDFAVLEAGIVSEETYIEQGEYWEELYHPIIRYVLDKHKPDLAMVGYPVTDEVQHQFLGLVTRKLPNGANNPSYDDVNRRRHARQPRQAARALHRGGLRGLRRDDAPRAEAHARQRPEHVRRPPTTASRRSSWPSTRARCSSTSACSRTRRPATAARRTRRRRRPRGPRRSARPRPATPAAPLQIYLNVSGRDPAVPGCRAAGGRARVHDQTPPIPAERTEAQEVARIKAAFQALSDPNDWTGDGRPEGWKVIDRVYTKAEARYIPNGAGKHGRHGPPDPHRRPRRVLATRRTSSTRRRPAR